MRKTDRKKTSGRSGTINKYFLTKTWDTRYRGQTLNQEEIEHRLNNNLPIDDLYSKLDNRYTHKGKHSKKNVNNGNKDL